jgi:hypothetical protein
MNNVIFAKQKMGRVAQLVQSTWFTPKGSGVRIPSRPQPRFGNYIFQSPHMIEIHSFENADFHDVRNLLVDAFSKNFDKDYNTDFLDCSSSNGFVVKLDNKVIGYASLHIIEKSIENPA